MRTGDQIVQDLPWRWGVQGKIFIIGGLGSIPGSILAALMLGYAETIVAYTISSGWTEIISVLATLLMLIFRPAGMFGKRAAF